MEWPTAHQARIAGLLYLTVIGGGLFAEAVVRMTLLSPGDALATANAIAANEGLWRWGLAVHLVYLAAAIAINVIVPGLFRQVEPTLARLATGFGITAVAIEVAALLQLAVPLRMTEQNTALAALPVDQREALAYFAADLYAVGFSFGLLFFACFCLIIGTLILRSALVPRVLGGLMVVAGACYILNSLTFILSPALSDMLVPWVLVPILVAELALALWLAIKGVVADPSDATLGRRSTAI